MAVAAKSSSSATSSSSYRRPEPAQPAHVVREAQRIALLAAGQPSGAQRAEAERSLLQQEKTFPDVMLTGCRIQMYTEEQLATFVPIYNDQAAGEGSLSDPNLGIIGPGLCPRCFRDDIGCQGHMGRIQLADLVYNPYMIQGVVRVLNCVCWDCGRLKFSENQLRSHSLLKYKGFARLNAMANLAVSSTMLSCSYRPEPDDVACRGCGPFQNKPGELIIYRKTTSSAASATGSDLHLGNQGVMVLSMIAGCASSGGAAKKDWDPVNIRDIYNVLDAVTERDAYLMGFENKTHPRNMIMKSFPVIPPRYRPSTVRDGNVQPHSITQLYRAILSSNLKAKAAIDERKDPSIVAVMIAELQSAIRNFMSNSEGSQQLSNQRQPGIAKLFNSKNGIFRGSMMGKRVNFSGRTVASPDPTLMFGELRIPKEMAETLTIPEVVRPFNIQRLTDLLREGKVKHIASRSMQQLGQRSRVSAEMASTVTLNVGDVVERCLQDGDPVIGNRQPTLHKESMMGFRVVVGRPKTIGACLAYTTPFNLDFDGDEMNIHVPQTPQALREVQELLAVHRNVLSGQTSRPTIAVVYDSITSANMLTRPGTRLKPYQKEFLLSRLRCQSHIDQLETLDARLRKHGVDPMDGKVVFSCLLPETFNYTRPSPKENPILIRDGILIQGVINKDHIGPTSNSIVQYLFKNNGEKALYEFFVDAYSVLQVYLSLCGFSVGLVDCLPTEQLRSAQQQQIAAVRRKIIKLGLPPVASSTLVTSAKNAFPSTECRVYKELERHARSVNVPPSKYLPPNNAFRLITDAKTKGGESNTSQIAVAVGQQYLDGAIRHGQTFGGERNMPYFEERSVAFPEDTGLITHSFFDGLSPAEIFKHQESGRVDTSKTAVSTPDTGHMQHKIVKSLEDMVIKADGSVRNANDVIYQFRYGIDGFNAAFLLNVKSRQICGVPDTDDVATFADIPSITVNLTQKYSLDKVVALVH